MYLVGELLAGVYLGTVIGHGALQLIGVLAGFAKFEGPGILATSIGRSFPIAFLCLLGAIFRLRELRRATLKE